MPNCCSVANCRTGYNLTNSDKELSPCQKCTVWQCECEMFSCGCKSRNCKCKCNICKPKLFSFPIDSTEREQWIRTFPNAFQSTENLYICEWHWPANYEKNSPVHKGAIKSRRPKYPRSVFKGVPASFSRSTSRTQSRGERLSRSDFEFDDMDVFIEQDKVGSLEEISKKLCENEE